MAKQRSGKKGLGCFFYGCLSIIAVILIAVVGVTWALKGFTDSMIKKYTAVQSIEIPMESLPEEELAALETKLAEFEQASRDGTEYELVMNSQELNAFVNQTDRFEKIKGRVHLWIEEDEIKGKVSLPLTDLGQVPLLGAAEGRYFNGEIGVNLFLPQGGIMTARLTSLSVNGKELPQRIFHEIQNENLLDPKHNNELNSNDWDHLESIQVQDGIVRLKTKGNESSEESAAPLFQQNTPE